MKHGQNRPKKGSKPKFSFYSFLVPFNLVQKATVDVHCDEKATVNAPRIQHTFVDVQNSAVQPHFQSSVVGGR